jgi:hypothetical protein
MEKNDIEEKIKVFDEKISRVESVLEDISKRLSEKKIDETKKIVDEPKPDEKPKEPIVIDAQKPKEDNSDKVVDAINKMGDKMVEEVKRVANPQSVAQTKPNTVGNSYMDDEKITEDLVEKYSKLHPEIKNE